ncbi:RNA polymerase subunit sigma-70 [Arachidicoccus ginsenosidimutans]|uniref:RNA polymerase sigma factor n=1 Tax=Arachidicoccus sp. BS20 TaxID=1850526 RepID=UPI0007F1120A|nr:RNA polymerase sigma factor [Arachidicoccus sp. BS20]ANI87894.1 RNA polymerase subunit sigma-70 [Arachidicoccus sp. BS20]
MNNQEELQIIQRICEGETNLFSIFLHRYSNAVYSLIIRIASSKEDAEELTQDVFLKAFKKLKTFQGKSSFVTWLYRIAYNTAISATRKTRQEIFYIDEKMIEKVPDENVNLLFENDENEDLLNKLQAVLKKLNAEEKTLITLYYTKGEKVNDIAAIMNLSSDNVKTKLYRVRKKLYLLMNNNDRYATR